MKFMRLIFIAGSFVLLLKFIVLLAGCSSVRGNTGDEEFHLLYSEGLLAYKSITKEDYLPPKEFN